MHGLPEGIARVREKNQTHLARNTSGDDDDLSASQSELGPIVLFGVAGDDRGGINVGDISGDTCV